MDQLVSDEAPHSYPNRRMVSERLLPSFYKFIDSHEDSIAREKDESKRAEMGKRLAVLSYFGGILIHQAPDGNGQTNKLISLSYIRQFCPQFRNNFFPIKYDNGYKKGSLYNDEDDLRGFRKDYISSVKSTLPPKLPEEDKKLFNKVKAIRDVQDEADSNFVDMSTYRAKLNSQIPALREVVESFGVKLSERTLKYEKGDKPEFFLLDLRQDIAEHLNNKYPGYHFSFWGDFGPTHDSVAGKEFVLTALLTEPDGLKALDRYVRGGVKALRNYQPVVGGDKRRGFYGQTANAFEFLEREFDRVLTRETKEVHDEKHKRYLALRAAPF